MSASSTPRVVCCLDGLDRSYLEATDTPEWDEIAATGTTGTCRGAMPSLTNVNNVSIASGTLPDAHGITGNSYFDRDGGEMVYMEDPSYLRCETLFETYAARDEESAALVVKEKLERFVERGCSVAASAENPPEWLTEAVGDPPGIYSGRASEWVVEAALHVLDTRAPDVLYVSTTDVVPHKHGPGTREANEWVHTLDRGLRAFAARDVALCATADHGMNHKTHRIDLDRVLAAEGVSGEVIPLIRDRHTYHHQNLGGAAYVYLGPVDSSDSTEPTAVSNVAGVLDAVDGVDTVLTAEEAAERFSLPLDRLGDLLVLGDRETVFGPGDEDGEIGEYDGEGDETHGSVDLRSHGSQHERIVPYVSNRAVSLAHNAAAFPALDEVV